MLLYKRMADCLQMIGLNLRSHRQFKWSIIALIFFSLLLLSRFLPKIREAAVDGVITEPSVDAQKVVQGPPNPPVPSVQNKNNDKVIEGAADLLLNQPVQNIGNGVAISKVVHQSWKTAQLPKRASRWSESWRRCFPDWQHRLWTDTDNLRLVQTHYPWLLETYIGLKHPVERADIVRYLYMHRYGGIYADLDALCLRNFTVLFGSASIVLGGMDHSKARQHETIFGTYVQNSLMASRPGHPFWLRVALRARLKSRWRDLVKMNEPIGPEYITGPMMLTSELRHYTRNRSSVKRPDGSVLSGDLLILPGRYLNPFSWSDNKNPENCRDLGNMTPRQEELCVASFPDAYVLQFHTQSWFKGHF